MDSIEFVVTGPPKPRFPSKDDFDLLHEERRLERALETRSRQRAEERATYRRRPCPNCTMLGWFDGDHCLYCGADQVLSGVEYRAGASPAAPRATNAPAAVEFGPVCRILGVR